MTDKLCLLCHGKLILKNKRDEKRKNYCSTRCRALGGAKTEAFKASIDRDCVKCGTAFTAQSYGQIYCKKNCQEAAATMRYLLSKNTIEHYLARLAHRSGRCLKPDLIIQIWKSQGGLCALTGQAMTHLLGEGRQYTNASLDRINPKAGYVVGNLQLVCRAANMMKQDFSLAQLRRWCELILENGHSIEIS